MVGLLEAEGLMGEGAHHPGGVALWVRLKGELVPDLFERLVGASGLPPIRLHDLRHGAATLMLAAGIDVKIVSDTLGHSDSCITRDIYQSVLPHVGKSAAEATANLVPLQRKAEAERVALKAEKAAKKAKAKAKAQAKAKKKAKRKKPAQ